MKRAIFSIVVSLLLLGCAANRHRTVDTIFPATAPATAPATQHIVLENTIIWNSDLVFGATAWRRVVNKRFGPTALMILCHGEEEYGEWWLYPSGKTAGPVKEVLKKYLPESMGHRPIVLLSCNPGGHELHGLPGVYYAKRNVICPCYDELIFPLKWLMAAGDINEFSSNE